MISKWTLYRLFLCGALFSLLSARVEAGPASPRSHLKQAQWLYEHQRYREAILELEAEYATKPKPRLLFNIGLCHLKLRQPREALDHFERFLKSKGLKPADKPEAEARVKEALALLEEMERPPPAPAAAAPPPPVPSPAAPAAGPLGPIAPPQADVATAVSVPPPALPAAPRQSPRGSRPRWIAAGILGGALALTLATSVALTVLNSLPPSPCEVDGMSGMCKYNTLAGLSAGYAASGLLAAGLVLTLALPERRKQ